MEENTIPLGSEAQRRYLETLVRIYKHKHGEDFSWLLKAKTKLEFHVAIDFLKWQWTEKEYPGVISLLFERRDSVKELGRD